MCLRFEITNFLSVALDVRNCYGDNCCHQSWGRELEGQNLCLLEIQSADRFFWLFDLGALNIFTPLHMFLVWYYGILWVSITWHGWFINAIWNFGVNRIIPKKMRWPYGRGSGRICRISSPFEMSIFPLFRGVTLYAIFLYLILPLFFKLTPPLWFILLIVLTYIHYKFMNL